MPADGRVEAVAAATARGPRGAFFGSLLFSGREHAGYRGTLSTRLEHCGAYHLTILLPQGGMQGLGWAQRSHSPTTARHGMVAHGPHSTLREGSWLGIRSLLACTLCALGVRRRVWPLQHVQHTAALWWAVRG